LLQTGRINDFILKFQQAFEFLLSALIKEKINENCGNTNFDKEICAYEEWAEELNLPREHFSGIPAKLNLLLHGLDSYSKLKDLIQIYSNINSGYINNYTAETLPLGIDSLRNRLAHEGIGIREEDNIEHITSAFEGIKNLLNIENSEVNYINMNSKILDEIYRYT
ncbi:MAG: hypothetical protein GXO24_07205, partial [Chlorobi bacterium]|nr:hypothetical protein [Chlorobiota bacterium]